MAQDESDKHPVLPRRNRAGAVGQDARIVAGSAFERAGFRDPTLIVRWTEIVGPEVARIARPLRMSESASGGVLTLKTEPAASTFLQHDSRVLCDRINTFLGRQAVTRLRFVQGELVPVRPLPRVPRPLGEAAASDPARRFQGPEKLKEALVNLARARQRPRTSGPD